MTRRVRQRDDSGKAERMKRGESAKDEGRERRREWERGGKRESARRMQKKRAAMARQRDEVVRVVGRIEVERERERRAWRNKVKTEAVKVREREREREGEKGQRARSHERLHSLAQGQEDALPTGIGEGGEETWSGAGRKGEGRKTEQQGVCVWRPRMCAIRRDAAGWEERRRAALRVYAYACACVCVCVRVGASPQWRTAQPRQVEHERPPQSTSPGGPLRRASPSQCGRRVHADRAEGAGVALAAAVAQLGRQRRQQSTAAPACCRARRRRHHAPRRTHTRAERPRRPCAVRRPGQLRELRLCALCARAGAGGERRLPWAALYAEARLRTAEGKPRRNDGARGRDGEGG